MSRAAVVAIGAVSPLGRGALAFEPGEIGSPAQVALARDAELEERGLSRPHAARAPLPGRLEPGRAEALLDDALEQLRVELGRLGELRPLGELRLGLALGSSSGGMLAAERVFEARRRGAPLEPGLARQATYAAPFEHLAGALEASLEVRLARRVQLVTACAASTWALGLGLRWLRSGACDLVFAGGYDALSHFVAVGFEALRATTASLPRPFRVDRDGMSLGEGAGIVAMMREADAPPGAARFFVGGFGAATDAVHVTAPDRSGDGLGRAASSAIRDADVEPERCVLVSAHATATPFNDAMEARAVARALGPSVRPVVHPFKAQIGHTLGAAGVLEALVAGEALRRGVAPAAAGQGVLDPDASVRLLERTEALVVGDRGYALKLSAAFGGANAALVLEPPSSVARTKAAPARHRARVERWARVERSDPELVTQQSGVPADRIARLDEASALLATVTARLGGRDELEGAGMVLGRQLATLDDNERFYRRVLERGSPAAEPRLFPPTSPNVAAGQVAILFGLRGPSCAVASGEGGELDALWLGLELLEAGDAEAVVVASVDVVGATSRQVAPHVGGYAEAATTGATAAWIRRCDEGGPTSAELRARLGPPFGAGRGQLALADAFTLLVP